jgi:hypothetical protein
MTAGTSQASSFDGLRGVVMSGSMERMASDMTSSTLQRRDRGAVHSNVTGSQVQSRFEVPSRRFAPAHNEHSITARTRARASHPGPRPGRVSRRCPVWVRRGEVAAASQSRVSASMSVGGRPRAMANVCSLDRMRVALMMWVVTACGGGYSDPCPEPIGPNCSFTDPLPDAARPFWGLCDPIGQRGCDPDERCVWAIWREVGQTLIFLSSCVLIDGTEGDVGAACELRPVDSPPRYDNCAAGTFCVEERCRARCRSEDECPLAESCVVRPLLPGFEFFPAARVCLSLD